MQGLIHLTGETNNKHDWERNLILAEYTGSEMEKKNLFNMDETEENILAYSFLIVAMADC